MSTKRNYFYIAVLVCFSALLGLAQANDAQSGAVAKTGPKIAKTASANKTVKTSKSSKSAKSSKRIKTASKKKNVVEATAAAPTQPANPYLSYQSANPYLANQPVNPFFASQASNPYLAYRYEKTSSAVQPVSTPNAVRPAASPVGAQRPAISKISFAPMPVTMYLNPNQRPTMAIATPCSAMEKMTGNNPMFKAFEQMAFGMIGNMNEAGFMPMIIEPVCT